MTKTLYVTDLDGTLLTSKHRISPYSLEIINELVAKGMLFTYATARSVVSASVVTEGLATNIPVIAYNGAFIINPATNEMLTSTFFTKEEATYVRSVLAKCGISPLVYAYVNGEEKVSWITSKENEGIRYYLEMRKGDKRFRPLEEEKDLYDGEMFYFSCIGEQEELQPIFDVFSKDERYTCTLKQEIYRTEYWCEILPKKATKAEAIGQLKKLWN